LRPREITKKLNTVIDLIQADLEAYKDSNDKEKYSQCMQALSEVKWSLKKAIEYIEYTIPRDKTL
jgi:hypothetical protein